MRSVLFILIFSIIQLYNVNVLGANTDNSERKFGDNCYLSSNHQGICSELSACESVKELLNQKRYSEIVHCEFLGRTPIVCCPNVIEPNQVTNVSKFSKALLCDVPKRSVKFQSKIILGSDAEVGEFPFYAAIGYKGDPSVRFQCGGSLIADNIVLTVAHCANKNYDQPIFVRLGRTSLDLSDPNDNSPVQDIEIDKFRIHSNYSSRSRQNDIALIKLKRPSELSINVQTICISSRMDNLPNSFSIIGTGISDTSDRTISNWLKKGTVNEYPFEQCRKSVESFGKSLAETQFCVAHDSIVKPSRGDSGGPLFYEEDQRFYIFGIVSYGSSYFSNFPGISTRVDKFLNWIETEMMALE